MALSIGGYKTGVQAANGKERIATVIFDDKRPAGSRAVCSLVPSLLNHDMPKLRECRGIVDGRSIIEAALVESVDDETNAGDGVWFNLRSGFQMDGAHLIHEDSFAKCRARLVDVTKCECSVCTLAIRAAKQNAAYIDETEYLIKSRARETMQSIRDRSARMTNATGYTRARIVGLEVQAELNAYAFIGQALFDANWQANVYAQCVTVCNARKAMIDANRVRSDALRFKFTDAQISENARLVRALHACTMVDGWSNARDPLPLVLKARFLFTKHLNALRAGTGDDSVRPEHFARHAWQCAYTESRESVRKIREWWRDV